MTDFAKMKEAMKDPKKMEEAFKKMFDALDKDHKGYLEPEVMKKQMQEKGAALGLPTIEPPEDRVNELKKIVDPNNTGKVYFKEFLLGQQHIMSENKKRMLDDKLRNAEVERVFGILDKDKKGYLDVAKIQEAEKKMDQLELPMMIKPSEEQKKQMLEVGDPQHTGHLTLEGCKAIASKMVEKMKAEGLL